MSDHDFIRDERFYLSFKDGHLISAHGDVLLLRSVLIVSPWIPIEEPHIDALVKHGRRRR